MKQVVQDIRSGKTTTRDLPEPVATPGHVIIATAASLISAGTERYVVELARKSLLGKARERPDHVKRVLQKLKQEGVLATLRQVRAKLDEPMPLGYSAAGTVLECGRGVQELKPGDRVAMAAPHAGVVAVGRNLCALIPDNVPFENAAYVSVAAIALEAVRLGRLGLADRALVIGLGLIGQITVALLKAHGCRVFGTDVDPRRLELGKAFGADVVALGAPLDEVRAFSDQRGVDVAIITAATPSSAPVEFAAEACRSRGRIVATGAVGLNLPRPPFYAKELEFSVSSSLGPGRGDPSYEDKGIDYPFGHARWTAQRNMQAVLELMGQGKLPVEKLTSHRISIDRAEEAYALITEPNSSALGVVLEYPSPPVRERRKVMRQAAPAAGTLGVSVVGAGNFARLVMLPLLAGSANVEWRGLCAAHGMNAEHSARKFGFAFATTELAAVLADEATRAVFIATRHDLHAEMIEAALRAGKHVFVEKPLCITPEELTRISRCVDELGAACPLLMVGFNRRFAPATRIVRRAFSDGEPLTVSYRFLAGALAPSTWPQDEEVGGGRIIGEASHAIDTCTAIVGSPPVRVYAESMGGQRGAETTDDAVFITLRHANGSVSNVSYQSRGDRALPSERLEVFGGGRAAIIDGWDRVEIWRGGKLARHDGNKDKGHRDEFRAFLEAARRGGAWPISWEDIYTVTWASMMAVRSLREGLPQTLD